MTVAGPAGAETAPAPSGVRPTAAAEAPTCLSVLKKLDADLAPYRSMLDKATTPEEANNALVQHSAIISEAQHRLRTATCNRIQDIGEEAALVAKAVAIAETADNAVKRGAISQEATLQGDVAIASLINTWIGTSASSSRLPLLASLVSPSIGSLLELDWQQTISALGI